MNEQSGVPHSGKFVVYYRQREGNSGMALDEQKKAVGNHLNGGAWEIIGEYTEAETGRRSGRQRPELKKALTLCEAKNAVLIVAVLEKLTRNVAFLSALLESRAKFIAVDIADFGNPSQNRSMLKMMNSLATHEANILSEKTKEGLRLAKKRGVKLGTPNPKAGSRKGSDKSRKQANDYAAEVIKIIRELEEFGCDTLQKVANGLEARGIKTARGGAHWYPSSVKNIKNRMGKN